jgi:hypothetical protein
MIFSLQVDVTERSSKDGERITKRAIRAIRAKGVMKHEVLKYCLTDND